MGFVHQRADDDDDASWSPLSAPMPPIPRLPVACARDAVVASSVSSPSAPDSDDGFTTDIYADVDDLLQGIDRIRLTDLCPSSSSSTPKQYDQQLQLQHHQQQQQHQQQRHQQQRRRRQQQQQQQPRHVVRSNMITCSSSASTSGISHKQTRNNRGNTSEIDSQIARQQMTGLFENTNCATETDAEIAMKTGYTALFAPPSATHTPFANVSVPTVTQHMPLRSSLSDQASQPQPQPQPQSIASHSPRAHTQLQQQPHHHRHQYHQHLHHGVQQQHEFELEHDHDHDHDHDHEQCIMVGSPSALSLSQLASQPQASQPQATQPQASQPLALDFPRMFKVMPCPSRVACEASGDTSECFYYHAPEVDRRRVNVSTYKPHMCRFVDEAGGCRKAERCPFAHNDFERRYHPDRFGKETCRDFLRGDCPRRYCTFRHHVSRKVQVALEQMETMADKEVLQLVLKMSEERGRGLCDKLLRRFGHGKKHSGWKLEGFGTMNGSGGGGGVGGGGGGIQQQQGQQGKKGVREREHDQKVRGVAVRVEAVKRRLRAVGEKRWASALKTSGGLRDMMSGVRKVAEEMRERFRGAGIVDDGVASASGNVSPLGIGLEHGAEAHRLIRAVFSNTNWSCHSQEGDNPFLVTPDNQVEAVVALERLVDVLVIVGGDGDGCDGADGSRGRRNGVGGGGGGSDGGVGTGGMIGEAGCAPIRAGVAAAAVASGGSGGVGGVTSWGMRGMQGGAGVGQTQASKA